MISFCCAGLKVDGFGRAWCPSIDLPLLAGWFGAVGLLASLQPCDVFFMIYMTT